MNDVLSLSAVRQAALIRLGEISSAELVRAHLERIARVDPCIHAVVELWAEAALAAAHEADRRQARGEALGPLHGVPFSIKDSIDVTGSRTTAGTLGRAAAPPADADATLVARLRAAGGIPLAKTNLPDLLFAFESDNFLFGRSNNPYDFDRTPGGSSGGEAALLASCGSPLGLGSDAAGSVRLPAHFCGIAAIKPTSGRLPRTGHFPPAGGWIERLWQIGPMARRVEDLAAVMPLLAEPDEADWTVAGMPLADPARCDLRKLRIAFHTDTGFAAADPETAAVVRAAAAALQSEVALVEEDRPACLARAYDLEMKLIGADGGDGLRQYARELGSDRLHPLLTGWLDKLESCRTDAAGLARYWSEWDAYRDEMRGFLRRYDAILCPVCAQPALPHGASIRDENFRGFGYTMAFNVAGWPAAAVRCGQSAAGLPIGVQVAAAPWREDIVLALAARLEEIFGGWRPSPHL